jgi:hypothetical protein
MGLTIIPMNDLVEAYRATLYEDWGWLGDERDRVILKLVEEVEELKSKIAQYKDWIGEPDGS